MRQVKLNYEECLFAAEIGCKRQVESIFANLKSSLTNGSAGWNEHIEGAAAELAYAKAAGVEWQAGVNTFKAGDVGDVQVRSTRLTNGRLIVRPRDPTNALYVFVRGEIPNFTIVGSIRGSDAKSDRYLFNPPGKSGNTKAAYFIPTDELTDFT